MGKPETQESEKKEQERDDGKQEYVVFVMQAIFGLVLKEGQQGSAGGKTHKCDAYHHIGKMVPLDNAKKPDQDEFKGKRA